MAFFAKLFAAGTITWNVLFTDFNSPVLESVSVPIMVPVKFTMVVVLPLVTIPLPSSILIAELSDSQLTTYPFLLTDTRSICSAIAFAGADSTSRSIFNLSSSVNFELSENTFQR